MRYAVIRGYAQAGPLYAYGFAEFSHETPKRIITKNAVFHRSIHPKADLVCLCETEAQAERVCAQLAGARGEYLRRVDAAAAAYSKTIQRLIAKARQEAEQLSLEIDIELGTKSPALRRARGFNPRLIEGGRE